MPFVTIRLVPNAFVPDTAAKKARIAAKITDAILAESALGEGDVQIVFEEVAASDWFVGKTTVAAIRKRNGLD